MPLYFHAPAVLLKWMFRTKGNFLHAEHFWKWLGFHLNKNHQVPTLLPGLIDVFDIRYHWVSWLKYTGPDIYVLKPFWKALVFIEVQRAKVNDDAAYRVAKTELYFTSIWHLLFTLTLCFSFNRPSILAALDVFGCV